ncbi:MAG: DUF6722 family protein [Nitrospiraceae bacterium]
MTARQRESVAKYCYDLSKIVLTVAVVTNAFSQSYQPLNFWLGMAVAAVFFAVG